MLSRPPLVLAVLLGLLLGACAGSTRGPQSSAATQRESQAGSAADLQAKPLPPIDMPSHIEMALHIGLTRAQLLRLAEAGVVPQPWIDMPAGMVVGVLGDRAGLIDPNQGVDLVSGSPVAPQQMVTVAFVPKNPDDLQRNLQRFKRIDAGRWLLGETKNRARSAVCEVWHGAAPIGFRVVCGPNSKRIAIDAPYLLGSVARNAKDAAFRAVFAVAPRNGFRELLAQRRQLRDQTQPPPQPGNATGREWMETAFTACETAELTVFVSDVGFNVELDMTFGSSHAPAGNIAEWLGADGAPVGLPDAFWRLPSDSLAALAFAGVDSEASRVATEAAGTQFRSEMTGGDRAADAELNRLFAPLLPDHGRLVLGAGRARTNPTKTSSTVGPGWMLLAPEVDPARFMDSLRRLLALPDVLSSTGFVQGSARGLPEGSIHLVYVPSARDYHVFIVVADDQVWLSIARDEALARIRATSLLARTPSAELGANTALRKLAERPLSGLMLIDWPGLALSHDNVFASLFEPAAAPIEHFESPPWGRFVPVWFSADRETAGTNKGKWMLKLSGSVSTTALGSVVRWVKERPE